MNTSPRARAGALFKTFSVDTHPTHIDHVVQVLGALRGQLPESVHDGGHNDEEEQLPGVYVGVSRV